MIRSLLSYPGRFVAAPLLALSLSASLAQADFRGGGALYDFSAACAQNGWPVGGSVPVRARYTPAEDVSAPPSQITIATPTGNEHISVWGNMPQSTGFVGAAGRQLWARFANYGLRPLVRVSQRRITLRINPSGAETIPNAREIGLRLRIQNFGNLPGCTAVLAATLRRI